jgi:ribosome-associated translation inhibitor RaiA
MVRATGAAFPEVHVRAHGRVSAAQRDRAVEKLRAACAAAPRPVLAARLTLAVEENPSLERPATAKASIDVSGRAVRAHVARPTLDEAVDLLVARIRRNLVRLAERREDAAHVPPSSEPGEWRHGSLPPSRPDYFPRPVEERQVVVRRSHGVTLAWPEEAAFDMDLLGHDFRLFADASSGADCMIHRRDDGELELVSADPDAGRAPAGEAPELPVRRPTTLALPDAIAMLEAAGSRYLPFTNGDDERLHVVYRRYDGHYGLSVPADAA